MRALFRGYYPPTDAELETLWQQGTIVPDTNLLLNLYKYPSDALTDMLAVLRSVQERLWLPHHVALEYHRRRERVIEAQLEVFEKVKRVLGFGRLKSDLDSLQLRRFHSSISVDGVLEQIKPALERFEMELSDLEERHVKPTGPDKLRDSLQALVEGRVGSPFTAAELNEIYRDGEQRYKNRIPPGYADEKDKKHQEHFLHEGTIYRPIYGDLVLWKQLIHHASAHGIRHVIFVSDDEKNDWREIREYRGHRELLPRPELIEEIRRDGGVEVFMIYSAESFLHHSRERLGVKIADTTIPQVSDIKAATRVDDDPRMTDEHLGLLQVTGEEGNRRDALLSCGFCHEGMIPMHFYEGDGIPHLSEVLGAFHYWQCAGYQKGTPVHLMVLGENREMSLFTWTPLPHQS